MRSSYTQPVYREGRQHLQEAIRQQSTRPLKKSQHTRLSCERRGQLSTSASHRTGFLGLPPSTDGRSDLQATSLPYQGAVLHPISLRRVVQTSLLNSAREFTYFKFSPGREMDQGAKAYKRALERGFILTPKESTLLKHGLGEWWERHQSEDFANLRVLSIEQFREEVARKEARRQGA